MTESIVITSVGRRVQLLRHFKEAGFCLIGTDMRPEHAPASRITRQTYEVPPYNDASYITTLLRLCEKEKAAVLIPLYEPELLGMAYHVSKFYEIGTEVIVSQDKALTTCLDKYSLYRFFRQQGIQTPATYLPEEFICKQVKQKYIMKPRRGMASQHVYAIENADDMHMYLPRVPAPIIQEFITGKEYTIDAYVAKNGTVRSVVPRQRLEVRAGEVSKSITRFLPFIIEESVRILSLLPFYGPITLQGIVQERDDKFYFTEINPRFGGGVPLAIQAGISYAELIKDDIYNRTFEQHLLPFQKNLMMLRYDEAFFIEEPEV